MGGAAVTQTIQSQAMVSLVVPKYPIGTTFLKKFSGYGVWEARVTSFEGDSYNVIYPEDGYVENFDCEAMDKVIAKSNILTEKNVPVVNRQTDGQTAEDEEPSDKNNRENHGGLKSFEKGQHVWVVMGKEKHPAIIHSITTDHPADEMPAMVRIEWSMAHTFEDVEIDSLLPMFEHKNGYTVTSSHSKRSRKRTDVYAPPSHKRVKTEDSKTDKKEVNEEETYRGEKSVKNTSCVEVAGSKNRRSKKSKGIYYHEGFKFHRIKVNARTPEGLYRCSCYANGCPVRLKLNRETGMTRIYAVNDAPVEHTDECKCKQRKTNISSKKEAASRREPVEKFSRGDGVGSKKTLTKKSKDKYYHEGFKFHRIEEGARTPEDLYRCSHSRSANCPVRLKLNRETGVARIYAVNDAPLEHTDKCKRKNGKSNISLKKESSFRGEPVKKKSRVDVIGSKKKSSKKPKGHYYHEGFKFYHHSSNVRSPEERYRCSCSDTTGCPVRLKLNRETGVARIYAVNDAPVEHTDECKRKHGKIEAAIMPTTATKFPPEEEQKKSLTPEVEEAGSPSLAHETGSIKQGIDGADSRSNNCQDYPFAEGEHVWVVSGKAKHPAVIDSMLQNGENDRPETVRIRWTTTNTIAFVEVNQLVPMFENENGKTVSSSFSRRKRKPTKRFEPLTQLKKKIKVDQATKLEYSRGKKPKKASIAAKEEHTKGEDSGFIRKNLDTVTRVSSGVAPGPGWTSKLGTGGSNYYWISPREEITFKHPRVAFEFEAIRQECHGDEAQALNVYKKRRKAAGKKSYIANQGRLRRISEGKATKKAPPPDKMPIIDFKPNATVGESEAPKMGCLKKSGPDFIRKNLDTLAKVPTGVAPGPGWTSRLKRGGHNYYWISPREEITFKHPRVAFEFEAIRQECNGDEAQALDVYKKRRKAAGKNYFIANQGRLRRVMEVKATKRVQSPGKMPSVELESPAEVGERTSPSTAPPVEVKIHTAKEEDAGSLDPGESMTVAEIEKDYNQLWDYYLKPTTREGEELPSGMKLRRKKALCNLLRFKNSVFRQKLHAKIIRLERLGRKDEIHRLLKAINDHDVSMQSGDGPCHLLEEILGQQTGDDEIEILDSLAITALKALGGKSTNSGNDVEDVESIASDESLEGDGLHHIGSKPSLDFGEIGHQDIAGSKKSTDVARSGGEMKIEEKANASRKSTLRSPPEMNQDEVINLCDDEDIDPVPTNVDQAPLHQQQKLFKKEGSSFTSPLINKEVNIDAKQTTDIPHNLSSAGSSGGEEIRQNVIDLCDDDDCDQAGLDQKPSYRHQSVQNSLEVCVSEETTMGSSITSSDTNSSTNRKVEDHKQTPTEAISKNLGLTDGSKEMQMGLRAVGQCGDENCEQGRFDQKPSREQQAVQNVFQEWANEETTTRSSAGSSFTNDHVDRNASCQKHKDGISKEVSCNNAAGRNRNVAKQGDCIDLIEKLTGFKDECVNVAIQQPQLKVIDLSQEE